MTSMSKNYRLGWVKRPLVHRANAQAFAIALGYASPRGSSSKEGYMAPDKQNKAFLERNDSALRVIYYQIYRSDEKLLHLILGLTIDVWWTNPVFSYIGPISPAEEAVDLKSIQAQFESAIGHLGSGKVAPYTR